MRKCCVTKLHAGLKIRRCRIESLEQIINARSRLLDEGHHDGLRACLDGKTNFEWSSWSALRAAANVVIRYGTQLEQSDSFAVHTHFELLAFGRSAILRTKIDF